jgi:hypothetical protein
MTKQRMTCPRCGRDVAANTVRGPRVNAGKPIPAIRVPVKHRVLENGSLGDWCEPARRGPSAPPERPQPSRATATRSGGSSGSQRPEIAEAGP